MTNTERQRAYQARMKTEGYTQIAGWIPDAQAAQVKALLRMLRENPHIEIATARDIRTGRMVRIA